MRKSRLLRVLFTVLALCMVLCALCPVALAADGDRFYVVSGSKAHLRTESSAAGGDATLVGTVYRGTVLRAQSDQAVNSYIPVLLDDGTLLYAHTSLLEQVSASAPTPLTLATLKGGKPAEEKKEETPPAKDSPYYLYYEKGSFTLTVYGKDKDGQYTKVEKQWRTAHGGNKTPAGKFKILGKERWHQFGGGSYTQYATRYHKKLYLHAGIYSKKDPTRLSASYYDGSRAIGKASSGGCLRMVCAAAQWIYQNCPEGTVLEIVNGAPRNTTSPAPPAPLYHNGERVSIDPTDIPTLRMEDWYTG